jgi:hypothetical protein
MNCKQGDLAVIVFSLRPKNVGRYVIVAEYIGKFEQGEDFEFRSMTCRAPVHDHYWWIEGDDLSIGLGPSPRAYIADSWLRPVKSPANNRYASSEEKRRRYEHG